MNNKRIYLITVFIILSNIIIPQQHLTSGYNAEETLFYDDNEIAEETTTEEYSGGDQSIPIVNTFLNKPISLSAINQNLKDVLNKISSLTGIRLVFNEELVSNLNVTVSVKNKPLKKVLDIVLAGTGVSYLEYKMGQVVLGKEEKIAEKTGSLKGTVSEESGEILVAANVVIVETGQGCATDHEGKFLIKNLKPGNYTIRVSFISYETSEQKVKISEGKTLELKIILKSTSFQIGGIEVIGNTDLLPTDASTKTVINSGEIEHYQASSIKDVLDLVPGVQKTDNPGLSKGTQIAVRGDESDQLSAFGTLIVVDGTPVSNNANLQFERAGGANLGTSNMGAGVDLRTIPADNIESIEVITGLPSVRYGDVTEGVINVKTKIGSQPHRLKVKNNPDTREANLGGGWAVSKSGISYNLNVAQSERDIRLDGDEYTRFTGQAVYSTNLFNNTFRMNHKLHGQTVYDEEAPKGDVYQTRNYNRGFTIGYSTWGTYTPSNGVSSFDYNSFITIKRENSMKSRLEQSDLRILPNGDTVSTYLGKLETKGIEWTIGTKLEWNRVCYTGNYIHKLLLGTEIQYNANTGEGVMFDTLYNPYGVNSGKRPYNFSDIPGQLLPSIFMEDKLTGHLLFDFNLVFGARYEMYRPFKFNLKGFWGDGDLVQSHQGTFFNPRLNLIIYLSDISQVRVNAGSTSKSPPMSSIYPPESVFRWRNPIEETIVYLRYNRRVPDLKGYKENQYEISYDHKFFNSLGTTFSAYYKDRKKEVESLTNTIPVFTTAQSGDKIIVYYIDKYNLPENTGWTISKGLEFSLKTNKIVPLNMYFTLTGSYNFINSSSNGYYFDDTPEADKGQYPNYKVPGVPIDTTFGFLYQPKGTWNDRIQLNYYLKYTLPALGLWITLRAEHLVMERKQDYNIEPEDYNLLTESAKVKYNLLREIKIKNAKWLFNLNISKSLFAGAEVSFYVNNFLDDQAVRQFVSSSGTISEEIRNPSLFYGIEFSATVDALFK